MPDFLWEMKWELDWLLSAQNASGGSGGLPDKLTALVFEPYGTMPDNDGQKRYFSGIGTAMTANVVAVMAKAARVYKDDAPTDAAKYLAAAQLGYAYLAANAGPAIADNDNPRSTSNVFSTGHYTETDPDNRLWAAAELWETTGDPAVLADFETRAAATQTVATDFDWPNVANLGIYTYLLSPSSDLRTRRRATRRSSRTLSASLMTAADSLVTTARSARVRPRDRGQLLLGLERLGRAHGDAALGRQPARPRSQVPEHHPDAGRLPAGAELLRSIAGDDGRLSPADCAAPRAVER